MTTISDINTLEKVLRAHLIAQSQMSGKFVRNSLSLHGEALEKLLSEKVFSSIDVNDAVMLFELRSRQNDSDMSETENDDSVSYYKSFLLYVIIYGDNSTNIANKLVARFRTQDVRLSLQNSGIYLEKISDATRLNEYKNETMWIRNDIEIDISCHLKIQPVVSDESFNSLDILINHV